MTDMDSRVKVRLADICHARSGDKGRHCTVGLIAWDPLMYPVLVDLVTEQVVADHFGDLVHGRVRRYPMPGIHALSFVLEDSLDGGGVRSLRLDAQGKSMCEAMLRLEVLIPAALADSTLRRSWPDREPVPDADCR